MRATHEADVLVVALGADYDMDATPGLAEGGNEFYSVPGAERLAPSYVRDFAAGRAIVGVCGAPFKCPPAPSEAALLLHDHLTARGVRDDCEITFVLPLPSPVPPSPETSAALLAAFAERDIRFVPGTRIASLDPARGVAVLDDGTELPYDLFLGVPKHRAPDVVIESGMTEDGYVPVDPRTLETELPRRLRGRRRRHGRRAQGGRLRRGRRRGSLAEELIAEIRAAARPTGYAGQGSCYIEFGEGLVGRVDVDFLGGPTPTGTFHAPSGELVAEKQDFGASRRARWFGL